MTNEYIVYILGKQNHFFENISKALYKNSGKEKKKMKDLEKMKRIFFKVLILLLIAKKADCYFFKNVENVTVSEGAEAIFSCKMKEEEEKSGYRVNRTS